MKPLPEPIAIYFQAKANDRPNDTIECFAPDAVVIDEGEDLEIRGREAIQSWINGTIAAYKLTTEITDSAQEGNEIVVTALVSGDFPGSPAEFDYRFVLDGSLILRLVIPVSGI